MPAGTASQWVDKLRQKSVIMRAGVQVIPFDEATFRLPKFASTNAPGPVAEGATIPLGDTE